MQMSSDIKRKLIVLTAPSGAGKTTIKTHLLNKMSDLSFSISATTREKRAGETHGKDYYFLSLEEFKSKIASDDFVEWEEVYDDQFYGTLKSELERIWELGKYAVLDIDVQGALSIKAAYPTESFVLFIKPPSLETLKKRLKLRKTESEESLNKRIAKAEAELAYAENFDSFIINDDLDLAVLEAQSLVRSFLEN